MIWFDSWHKFPLNSTTDLNSSGRLYFSIQFRPTPKNIINYNTLHCTKAQIQTNNMNNLSFMVSNCNKSLLPFNIVSHKRIQIHLLVASPGSTMMLCIQMQMLFTVMQVDYARFCWWQLHRQRIPFRSSVCFSCFWGGNKVLLLFYSWNGFFGRFGY